MPELVTFGEMMLRYSPPDQERLETVDELDVHVAGTEGNVAVAAQRLGLDATWLSKLPDSPLGRRVTCELGTHGVDPAVVWDKAHRMGTYYVEMAGEPRGTDVIYDRADSAVTTATPDELRTELISGADLFHTTGITPALSSTLESTTAELLTIANEAGTTTVFDLNYRGKLWSPSEAREVVESLLPAVDVFVLAERDARAVLGREGDAATIARELDTQFGFDVTILTRGADGALALAADRILEQPVFDADDHDPVGTGDAFVGGFLAEYHDGGAVAEALEVGAATAALKRTVPGDLAVVTQAEVRAVIEGNNTEIDR
jgi:2-dehydro-3-deoxygluconokinase